MPMIKITSSSSQTEVKVIRELLEYAKAHSADAKATRAVAIQMSTNIAGLWSRLQDFEISNEISNAKRHTKGFIDYLSGLRLRVQFLSIGYINTDGYDKAHGLSSEEILKPLQARSEIRILTESEFVIRDGCVVEAEEKDREIQEIPLSTLFKPTPVATSFSNSHNLPSVEQINAIVGTKLVVDVSPPISYFAEREAFQITFENNIDIEQAESTLNVLFLDTEHQVKITTSAYLNPSMIVPKNLEKMFHKNLQEKLEACDSQNLSINVTR